MGVFVGRKSSIFAAAGAVVLLTAFSAAAPAAAAPVTTGTILFSDWETGTLYTADIAAGTGELTQLGPVQDIRAVTGIDVDDTTRLGFAVTWGGSDDAPFDPRLFALDANTGTYTLIGVVSLADETPLVECLGLDLSVAGLVLTCQTDDDSNSYTVGTVDPATAVYTPLVSGTTRYSGLATNPVDGLLYAIDYDAGLTLIDLAGGTATPVGPIQEDAAGAAFDRNGTLWTVDFDGSVNTTSVTPPPTTTFWHQLVLTFEGGEGFTVIDAPVLPATGPANLAAPFALAALAVIAGVVALLARRRTA
jgi:hypothetical protein